MQLAARRPGRELEVPARVGATGPAAQRDPGPEQPEVLGVEVDGLELVLDRRVHGRHAVQPAQIGDGEAFVDVVLASRPRDARWSSPASCVRHRRSVEINLSAGGVGDHVADRAVPGYRGADGRRRETPPPAGHRRRAAVGGVGRSPGDRHRAGVPPRAGHVLHAVRGGGGRAAAGAGGPGSGPELPRCSPPARERSSGPRYSATGGPAGPRRRRTVLDSGSRP